MDLKVKEITDKTTWENFLLSCENKTFLNSWGWGEFQKKLGHKIWRLGVFKEYPISLALVVKIKARRGTFLFIPHGPNTKENKKEVLKIFLEYLKKIAEKEKADFIRFSPIWERNKENARIFKNLKFRKAPIHIHPEVTWILDIDPREEEILKEMRKNTRYEIKKGIKNNDLQLIKSDKKEDIEKFNNLYKETACRHGFVPFSLDYLNKEYESFIENQGILTFHVKYKEEILSSAIVVFWQNMAFYHHGASILKYSKIPSSHLLQWEIIKEAKKRNCSLYNFWGVADISEKEMKKKKHPWAGLSIFKKGFGGSLKEYVKTQDFPISKKYWLNLIIESLRRIKRGY